MTNKNEMPDDIINLLMDYTRNSKADVLRFLGAAEQCGYSFIRAAQPLPTEDAQRALEVFNAMIEYGEHALEYSFAEMLNNMPVKEAFVTIRAALARGLGE